MKENFETFGYFKEYYINNTFVGTIQCEKDRDTYGYYGKRFKILKEDILLDNKKKIKKGIEVNTMLFPLNGKKQNNK